MNEKEIIKALTTEIITPKERGTGLLIDYKNNPSILTVHHCIYGKNRKAHNIEADDIKIVFSNKAEYFVIDIEIIGELVILTLDSKEFAMQHYPRVEFAEVEYEQNYHIRGFPSGLKKPHNFTAKCNDIDRETFKIEIDNLTSDTSGEDAIEYMRGVSGSGVFFARDKKLYLVGLVNALANQSGTFNAVECINLRKLIKNKKSKFNYLWIGLPLILGGLAFLFYPNSSESEPLAPKKELKKEVTRLKPSIPSEKKRAILHINKSPFSSVIESALSKEFILVEDEKKANYIIEVNSKIESNEITVYGENFIKSSCEIRLKIIELQSRDIIKSEVFKAIDTKVDEDSSSNGCFEKVVGKLKF